jgi:hypothetical protein
MKFEERASRYVENTLERKVKTQSSPWVAPPQIAGELKMETSSSGAKMLDSTLPTPYRIRRSLLHLRGRTTWL